jgi:hypothetical protein
MKSVKIEDDLHRELKSWCALNDMSMQEGTELALKKLMAEKPIKKQEPRESPPEADL